MTWILRTFVALWIAVAAYSGIMLVGFCHQYFQNERALSDYTSTSGVTLDSLLAVNDPLDEYVSDKPRPDERTELLTMAMYAQGRTRWGMAFGVLQWLILVLVLPWLAFVWLNRQLARRPDLEPGRDADMP